MSNDPEYYCLQEHKLFKSLTDSEINYLCCIKVYSKTMNNDIINLPYSKNCRLFYLIKGTLKLLKISDQGEETLIGIIQKGELFEKFNLEPSITNLEFSKVASNQAILCFFYQERLEEMMQKNSNFALDYIRCMSSNYIKLQKNYKYLLLKDVKIRLMLFFDGIIENELIQQNTFTGHNYLTQKDIAQLIRTSRQTVIALLNELEKEGVLYYSQKQIHIPNIKNYKAILNTAM